MKKFLSVLISILLVLSLNVAAVAETGDPLLIGVPNDGTNLSRAIKLLEAAGLITVDPDAGYTPEISDITSYIYNIEIMPVSANTLTATLADYAACTINGTYAIPFGLRPSEDGLIVEQQSEDGDNPYVNVIVARTEDAENETYLKIVEAVQTQIVAEFVLESYNGASIPVFDYDEDYTVEEDFLESIIGYTSDSEGKTVVKIGICGSNDGMWNAVQKVLDEEGADIYLEIVEFDAYNLPNDALNSGEIDLNSFQHIAYLESEIEAYGYDLTAIGDTFIAPLTLYSNFYETLDELKEAAGLVEE